MPTNELIWLPIKRTSDIDVIKPLRNIIASTYSSSDNPVNLHEQLGEFQKLRKAAISVDRNEAGFNALANYYDQICSLEQKIPCSEVQIAFKWKDAFDKGSIFGGRISLTIPSMAYEKVCVLFNLATVAACVAADQNLDQEDGLQKAMKKCSLAAGIFAHLKENIVSTIQQDPTPDLMPETLGTLHDIMLAQAQEMIVLKAVNDKMKDGIIAKLCAQCEDLYSTAFKNMSREVVRNVWESTWMPNVGGKQGIYHGMAEYHQSRLCNANKAIGEEIARLGKAKTHFTGGQERSGGSGSDLCQVKDWLRRTEHYLATAKKDNDFIYHERVPDSKSLAAIPKVIMVKATTPLPARIGTGSLDLFDSLCPVAIHQAMASYDSRRSGMVDQEVKKLRESTTLLNELLSSMNLPAAIEDTSSGDVPQSLKDKAQAVKNAGGLSKLQKLIGDLPESLQRNTEILDECERSLKEEKDSDTQLKTQFKEKWTRTPSADLTGTFTTNANKYRSIINNAKQADGVVKTKLDTHMSSLEILSKGANDLASAIPASGGHNVKNSLTVTKLRALMEDVETIKVERQVIESEIMNAKADVKPLFFEAFKKSGIIGETEISTESLARLFGPLQMQATENVSRQEALIKEIQENHEKFIAETGGGSGNAREEKLKALAAAHDTFFELMGNLEEGTKFYNDLTQLLLTFQNKVSDFCFARKCEKEELLKDMTSSMASMKIGDIATPQSVSQGGALSTPGEEPNRPPRKNDPPPRPPQPASNPYAGAPTTTAPAAPATTAAPAAPVAPAVPAPAGAQPNPYAGAPYPPAPGYPPAAGYTPMPPGFNPYGGAPPGYAPPPAAGYPAYPQYPPQGHQYPGNYPGYPPAPAPGYPPYPPQQWPQQPPQ